MSCKRDKCSSEERKDTNTQRKGYLQIHRMSKSKDVYPKSIKQRQKIGVVCGQLRLRRLLSDPGEASDTPFRLSLSRIFVRDGFCCPFCPPAALVGETGDSDAHSSGVPTRLEKESNLLRPEGRA